MTVSQSIWRHDDGAFPNLMAFSYLSISQVAGLWLLTSASPLVWIAGILLVAHSLVIAGYMIHDIAHLSVFRSRQVSNIVGEILSWLCGSAYAPFSRIQRMHFRHHGDRADLALFDPREFLKRAPNSFRRIVYLLEWLYIPAVELIMHFQVMTRPFYKTEFASERPRVIIMGLSRLVFFLLLFSLSPWALFGYAIAYLLFLTVLFISDAYAHTYEFFLVTTVNDKISREGRNGDYDKHHTFSNLISERWPWLNLFNLNFGYHSAHHDKPSVPWYRLPKLHRETYSDNAPQILPYRDLWRTFHVNRLKRIEAQDPGSIGIGSKRADDFLGVHGVSFLSVV